MYANFYYRKSTATYGTGPWLDVKSPEYEPLLDDYDFVYIGRVYDEKLFAGKEFDVSPSCRETAGEIGN